MSYHWCNCHYMEIDDLSAGRMVEGIMHSLEYCGPPQSGNPPQRQPGSIFQHAAARGYTPILNDAKDLEQAVFMALGAASVCWDAAPTGLFDSTRAKDIGEELLQFIEERYEVRQKVEEK